LITGLELNEELELFALDVSRAELEADIVHESAKGLTEILAERGTGSAGGKSWSVVCLLESFAADQRDAHLVGSLGMCAHAGGTIVFAGAHDSLAGVGSIAESPRPENWTQSIAPEASAHWHMVRSLTESKSIGLALPRVLSRLPYSPTTDPVDAFDFIESPPGADHELLAWSNAATYCTLLLGRAFSNRGWSLDLQAGGEIDGLPVYVAESGPDRVAKPCAEAWLTDSAASRLLEKGLIPILSVQHRDAIRIPRMTSITGGPLNASWA
jgi:type VI secretion system protein ImpC